MSFSDLPLISELTKPYTSKVSADRSVSKKTKPAADRRLLHWEEWMNRRKQMHQKLGQLLKRNPEDLLMNAAEEIRAVKEKRMALEYTAIPEPDIQRGCPGFWKLPNSVKNECGDETYFFAPTIEDKCEVPVIEHVGVSTAIFKEKDVLPRTRNSYASWEKSVYLQRRIEELSEKLEKVDPYQPDFSELFIRGIPIGNRSEKKVEEVPASQKAIKTLRLKQDGPEPPSDLRLSINNFLVAPYSNISGTRKVYLFFDYDITTEKVDMKYLTLRNEGTTTIRFYWKLEEKPQYFRNITGQKERGTHFYFNKNKGLIIPGATIQFPVWFKTKTPGTFCEQWEFCTQPRITPENCNLVIVLHASAEVGDLSAKIDTISEQLNENVRNRLIKEVLFRVVSDVFQKRSKPIVYSYNKRELFESINSKFDPVNRQPKYLYNLEVVRELQQFYQVVRRPLDPKVWNYNIEELQLLARAKERRKKMISKNVDNQGNVKNLDKAKPALPKLACEKHAFPLLSSINRQQGNEKEDVSKQKYENVVDDTITHIVSEKQLPEQLEEILSKLERPKVEFNCSRNKYMQAYLILSTYFSKIGEEILDLQERLGIIDNTKYPTFQWDYSPSLYYRPTRLISENLYHALQGFQLVSKVGTDADKPAAEILQNLPVEDSKMRYKTYYNLPDTPPPELDRGRKKSKKDGKKGDKKSKSDKKDTKKDKGKSKKDKKGGKEEKALKEVEVEDDGYIVNEAFDPYADVDLPIFGELEIKRESQSNEQIESNNINVPLSVKKQYKINLYIIIYTYLDKAISNIVDMIEMQPQEKVPYPVIKQFEEPKYNRRLVDLKGLLAEESANLFKAKLILYKYRKHCKTDWKTKEIQRQLKRLQSDSSLWSSLRSCEMRPKLPANKPISYPVEHYDNLNETQKGKTPTADNERKYSFEDTDQSSLLLKKDISTSTLNRGVLDENWEDFKDAALQKSYDEEEPDDLIAYIEKIADKTSVQSMEPFKLEKSTQKDTDDHVSDEEYFYFSDSDIDTIAELYTESELDSEQSEYDPCTAIIVNGCGQDDKPCKLEIEKHKSTEEHTNNNNVVGDGGCHSHKGVFEKKDRTVLNDLGEPVKFSDESSIEHPYICEANCNVNI